MAQEYEGGEIVRSRVPAVLAEADVVIDVGAVYDPGRVHFAQCKRANE